MVRVAVQVRVWGWGGGAQVRWRLRSDGGARRLGFRLGGGVQRRLVWRCSAGWGGGAGRRTARVSRGVATWPGAADLGWCDGGGQFSGI